VSTGFLFAAAWVKETLLPGLALFTVTITRITGRRRMGAALMVLVVVIGISYGQFGGRYPLWGGRTEQATPFEYLGNSPAGALTGVVLHPTRASHNVFSPVKALNLVLMAAPLGYLPSLAPLSAAAAIPGVGIGLLSPNPLHLRYDNHYALAIVPFLFVAAVLGMQRVEWRRGVGREYTGSVRLWLVWSAIYYSALVGPAPWSAVFWGDRAKMGPSRYFDPARRAAGLAVLADVPPEGRVVVENSIWHSSLAARSVTVFPSGVDEAQAIVLDLSEPPFVEDRVDPDRFSRQLAIVRRDFRQAKSVDGISLWIRKQQPSAFAGASPAKLTFE
jgi:hypothetical protein